MDFSKNNFLVVGIGLKIDIEVNGEHQSWKIVDFEKTDIKNGKISCQSPLIQQILGAKIEDKIHCKIVNRDIVVIIKNIST